MFHKSSTYGQAEYTARTVSSTIPDASHFGPQTRSGSSGAVAEDTMAGSSVVQKSCVKTLGHDPVVERLCAFLSGRVSERVTLKELSRFLGYSEKYASDVFQRYMGRPFSKHLKQLRLDKATSMLLEERHTITKIAESVGFSDAFAFSHFFKRAVGCSPTEYRRQQLRQADMA
ncbi:MAG: hypothetical protein LZF60_420013 [Nitrospira sp.]|nr:MAG: hypothetical protein LZF60_420013 [Nitrospira sp.]